MVKYELENYLEKVKRILPNDILMVIYHGTIRKKSP